MYRALKKTVCRARQYSQKTRRPEFNSVSKLSSKQIMNMIRTGKPINFDGYNFFETIKTNDEIRTECENFLQYGKIMYAISGRLRRVPTVYAVEYVHHHVSSAVFCASTGYIFANYIATSPHDMYLTIVVIPVWLAFSILQGTLIAIFWQIFLALLLIAVIERLLRGDTSG